MSRTESEPINSQHQITHTCPLCGGIALGPSPVARKFEIFTCPRCLRAGLHSIHPWRQADDALADNGEAGRMICTACANHLRLGEPDPCKSEMTPEQWLEQGQSVHIPDRADWKRFDEAELG